MQSIVRSGCRLSIAAGALLVASIAWPVEYIGTSFRVEWDPATGNPDGYIVLTGGSAAELVEHHRTAQGATQSQPITGQLGDTLVIGVSAYRGDYQGPTSETLSVTLVADAPGAVRLSCADESERLIQLSGDTFACVGD